MLDLIALAKRDNDFNFSEKLLIKEIGKKVGFGDDWHLHAHGVAATVTPCAQI
jgi:hypothetical protein